jgi:hypothetical protein
MSDASIDRSYQPISDADLRRLGRIAAADRDGLYARRPETGRLYAGHLFAVALCQGAALHRVNGKNGVKDFDVWSFYAEQSERAFPYRRRGIADFGDPKFGVTQGWGHFVGRRVDLIGRSLAMKHGADPVTVLRNYLRARRTTSANHLAAKAVVLIEPLKLLGTVVWPDAGA